MPIAEKEIVGMKLDLVQIIKDNPGCTVTIDNDCWEITAGDGSYPNDFDDWNLDKQRAWERENTPLASSSDEFIPLKGSTYQANNCYGGAILLALAEIVGINIQSV